MYFHVMYASPNTIALQYDAELMQKAAVRKGYTWRQLGEVAGVDQKTARTVVMTGRGHPDKIFAVAKALGFKVRRNDLSAIMLGQTA